MEEKKCLACGAGSDQVPLIPLEYRGTTTYICAPHFPILIHAPAKLAGKLPGAESLPPSEHED